MKKSKVFRVDDDLAVIIHSNTKQTTLTRKTRKRKNGRNKEAEKLE